MASAPESSAQHSDAVSASQDRPPVSPACQSKEEKNTADTELKAEETTTVSDSQKEADADPLPAEPSAE